MQSRYHHLKIKVEQIPQSTFRTRYGHFQFLVMPFGLTNALVTFLNLMNRVFQGFLDRFIVVFIDHILIYSKSQQEREENLRLVLRRLQEEKLYAKLSKCDF